MSTSNNDLVQLTSNVERAGGDDEPTPATGLNRRNMLKALAATAALPMLVDACAVPDSAPNASAGGAGATAGGGKVIAGKGPRGTPSDPILINPKPRITWPLLLTKSEMTTLEALGDVIIPADEKGPAASKVRAADWINESVSEPSRGNQLVQIRGGIMWINAESMKRFSKPFHELDDTQKTNICDDICFAPKAKPEFMAGALFFDRVRDMTAGGYYTTPEGWKDIGYIGNVALPEFKGPPQDVLVRLGLV